jgi:predicted nucleic acid-binding protein
MIYVMDASAWLRYALKDGPACEDVEAALASAANSTTTICAPQHLAAEVAHVLHRLRRQGSLTLSQSKTHLDTFLACPIQYRSVPALTVIAFQLAWQHRLSVYDALYLSLAMGLQARLLTVDEDLIAAARVEHCA